LGSFKEDLRDRLERGPEMDMKGAAGLGLAIHWVQQALILAYENNCPLRTVQMGRQSLKWMAEWESLRKGMRHFLMHADQIRICIVGNSTDRLSGITRRR
jgi:hypothetical protein